MAAAGIDRFVVKVGLTQQAVYPVVPVARHRLDAREGQVVVVYAIVFARVSHYFLLPVVALYRQIHGSHPATRIYFP